MSRFSRKNRFCPTKKHQFEVQNEWQKTSSVKVVKAKSAKSQGRRARTRGFSHPFAFSFFQPSSFRPPITSHGALIHCPNHRQPIKVLNKIGVTTFLNLYCAPINAIHPIYIERTSNECGASYDLLSRTTDANIWILM